MLASIQNQRFRHLLLTWPEKAIRFIYEAYYDNLLIISQRLTHDILVAEDIVQEVYAGIWHNHKQFSAHVDQSIEYYLVTTVKEKSMQAYNEKIRYDSERMRKARLRSNFPTDEDIFKLGDSECLKMVVDRLTKTERTCFHLKYKEGLTMEQMAQRLDKPHEFIIRKLIRVKRKLKSYQWALS